MKRFDSIQVSNIFRGALMLAVLLVPSAVQAQVNWQAIVGTQSSDKGRQAMAFLPNELWIHAGESITWTSHTDESHTVTFLTPGQIRPRNTPPPPASAGCPGTTASGSDYTGTDGTACVHSGSFVSPATYTVNFPTAGNYKLVCLIHASMTGVVHVLGMSETLPHNQAFYDDQAVDEGRDLLSDRDHDGHDWDDDRGDWRSPRNAVTAGIGEVVATGGGTSYLAVMRFLKGTIKVHVGDTVEWTNLDPAEPHTITFGTEPANPPGPNPPGPGVTVDTDGARHATISSLGASVHSGFIAAAPQERIGLAQAIPASPPPPAAGQTVTRFRVTFTVPGTFNYICALHDELGMKGKVVVVR